MSDMSETAKTEQRTLLMRCELVNANRERSVRYVDHDIYPLWRARLATKHRIRVAKSRPCMWVPLDEARRTAPIAERAPLCEPVHRLAAEAYDPDSGLTTKVIRFAPTEELGEVREQFEQRVQKPAQQVRFAHGAGHAIAT